MVVERLFSASLLVTSIFSTSYLSAGQWQNNGQEISLGSLSAFVYEPTSTPVVNNKRALMVSLHGCMQTHEDFKQGAGWKPIADELGMVVVLPQASGEGPYGSLAGCWNYQVGMEASREASDHKYLLELVNTLLSDSALNIDSSQVYLTGFSSGAGMVNQLACLAPDFFAGVGSVSGPMVGSDGSSEALNNPSLSVIDGKNNCLALATKDGYYNEHHLFTQIYNSINGLQDGAIHPQHARNDVELMKEVYKRNDPIESCGEDIIPGIQAGKSERATLFCDAENERVSEINITELEHAWPAGESSPGGEGIDNTQIDYPAWISRWFFANNKRVNQLVLDKDGDGVPDDVDNCPSVFNPDQLDSDGDGIPDACPLPTNQDMDEDGIDDSLDNCPSTYNPDQVDGDNNGIGTACDPEEQSCESFESSTYTHVAEGRAYMKFGLAYGKGSGDYLGFYSFFGLQQLKTIDGESYQLGRCDG